MQKASRGTTRLEHLTTSPCCARYATEHEHSEETQGLRPGPTVVSIVDSGNLQLKNEWKSSSLSKSMREYWQLGLSFRDGKPVWEKKDKSPCKCTIDFHLHRERYQSHFDQVGHRRSKIFAGHLNNDRFLGQSLVSEQSSPSGQSGRP